MDLDGRNLEHVVDIGSGIAVDRDFEGTPLILYTEQQATEQQRRQDEALARLRELKDPHPMAGIVRDLLTVLGVD